MKRVLSILLGVMVAISLAAAQSPYAGQERRSIKAISAEEADALKKGEGMGFAKAAELNHYPGPKHVLDLSRELALTPAQKTETELLFADMHSRAKALGNELLVAEAALDRAFAENEINAETLEVALLEIGQLRARLRFVHLRAHLRQRELLTGAQITLYDELRGYMQGNHEHAGHSVHHE